MEPTAATPTEPTADLRDQDWLVRKEPHPDAPGLADLVDDVACFRTSDVYRRPSVSSPERRRDPKRFACPDALWDDLLRRSARRPTFRLVRGGTTTAPSAVTRPARIGNRDLSDLIAPNRVVSGYRDGATVVLQGLHLTDPGLAEFANNLALELDQPVQVNAYLSPPSAQGLDIHFDYHDVFVVQLDGAKRWVAWPPTEMSRDPIGGPHATPRPSREELGEPIFDLVLEPGDVLYLPRGHAHLAETTDRASAHLTVGLLAITWHRVIRRAIDDEVTAGRLRSSIPVSTLEPDPSAKSDQDLAEAWTAPDLGGLGVDLRSVAVRRWVAREIWRRQAATRLRPRRPPDPAATEGWLAVSPGPLITLSRAGRRSELFIGDRTITMPDEAHAFLTALVTSDGPFRRADLAGLDHESSRVVIHRLLDEGVLVEADPGDSA